MNNVDVEDLRADLDRHLRRVRHGVGLTILQRGKPIARIVPADAAAQLETKRATKRLSDLCVPEPPAASTDSLAMLLRDRASW